MTALTTIDQPSGIVSQIERIACNPEADINKLEKLWDMKLQAEDREAKRLYMASMSACQSEMPTVVRDAKNQQTNSSYAKFETIIISSKPCYTKHGFSLSFGSGEATTPGYIRTTCEVMHDSGYSTREYIDLPLDNVGIKGSVNKTDIHATKSSHSYGERTLFCKIFSIPIAGYDDDGQAAGQSQIQQIVNNHDKLMKLNAAAIENWTSISCIKESIAIQDYETAAEAWYELDNATKEALWIAPTKGGLFTTIERKSLKEDIYAFHPARKDQNNEQC